MEEAGRYERWVARYVEAWNSNDAGEIGALFTPGARYFTAPYRDPWEGHDEIVTKWIEAGDRPGDTDFRYDILIAGPELGIVKGVTHYKSAGVTYHNLWEIRLEGDLCREFVEWWMETDQVLPRE